MHARLHSRRVQVVTVALLAAVAAVLPAAPARAVHESHHGPFVGTTSQGKRLMIRVLTHTRLGIRVRWEATCTTGELAGTARFRRVRVDRQGRFFVRNARGIGVRGKIGFDPQGDPVFPAPFSFANNEARGRIRVVMQSPTRGRCRSGTVTWEARR